MIRLLATFLLLTSPAALAGDTDPEPADDLAKPTGEKAKADAPPEPPPAGFVEDRARSVTKAFDKRGRFALTALGNVSVNDAFFTKVGGGLQLQYFLRERLAVGIRGSAFVTVADEDTRIARANLQSVALVAHPVWAALAELEWTPLYGKMTLGGSIVYLDGFLTAGLGALGVPRAGFAFEVGGGLRVSVTEWLAVTASLLNTTHTSQAPGAQLGLLQNLTLFSLGVTLFMPFSSGGDT